VCGTDGHINRERVTWKGGVFDIWGSEDFVSTLEVRSLKSSPNCANVIGSVRWRCARNPEKPQGRFKAVLDVADLQLIDHQIEYFLEDEQTNIRTTENSRMSEQKQLGNKARRKLSEEQFAQASLELFQHWSLMLGTKARTSRVPVLNSLPDAVQLGYLNDARCSIYSPAQLGLRAETCADQNE
jgi:hypothetical protein